MSGMTPRERADRDEKGYLNQAACHIDTWENREEAELYATHLSGVIDYAFNPPDGDVGMLALLTPAVLHAMRFIEDQQCLCDAPELIADEVACERCDALGRHHDERRQR